MKSLYKAFIGTVSMVCLLLAIQSCKPSIPSKYLSKGEMADVLYDIHVAEAMSNLSENRQDTAVMVAYRVAILKKHGLTAADFDSSMVYYMRHTKLMHDVYDELADRLKDEAQSLGADVSESNRFGSIAVGDTANVWNGASSYVFSSYAPFNYQSFEVPVDTSFHKADKLMLDFDAQFLFQDGMRDGIVTLAVTFKNDSVASSNLHITSSQHYSLQVEDRDSLGIKSVKGFFMLNNGDYNSGGSSLTTLRMMFVQKIRLVRLHARKAPDKKNEETSGGDGNGNASSQKTSATSDSVTLESAAEPSSRPSGTPRLSGPNGRPLPPPDKLQKMELSNPKPIHK